MTDPLMDGDGEGVLRQVYDAAGPYLASLADRPVLDPAAASLPRDLAGDLPDKGEGAAAAVRRLLHVGTGAATHSAGPRFFHFVIGGVTPAALAGDWTASLLDQNAAFRNSSAFATEVETVALRWLRELFGLPEGYGGALVASATFANFTGLGTATHWWGERHGADIAANGLAGLPRMPVLSSGYVHASSRKALQMLGHGRESVEVFARDPVGRVDLAALERRLAGLRAPAVVIANAGEVNAGDFDPVADLADLAERYGAWLHVDGAFGLFAALSPRTAGLVAGIERADSIACDAHKWLNVPYESGFAFLREPARLAVAFGMPGAAYLPGAGAALDGGPGGTAPHPGYALLGPESSRRARSLPIWATLAAYGRSGHQAMVERHLDLAQHLAALVDAAPDLERLADVPLCIVCFRVRPAGVPEQELDDLNRQVGAALLADGRVFAGTTVYGGRVALRPAIVNWRTTESDITAFVEIVRSLIP
ncbi:pyridoxal phosphate-dependent decarboxylase family protein [Phytohabitans suffuscus]|uniref:Aspartate aminotransferase family protein n=1 Tax=Phytohabitans suffuscus TaxID=624315 RepID=A0A6F8YDD0_9ACTN|nr:pyridoxal-dependent decarboxylase [Phytohabitans suffuscus]BCB84067.1 aspartate aminotransferase family protein [Phytohabitans suffuscus]